MFSEAPLLPKRLFATGFAVILAVASFAVVSVVNADDGYIAQTWKFYHWDWNSAQQPQGFELSIGTNFSDKYTDVADWNDLLSLVEDDWDESDTLDLSVGDPSLNDPKKCPPTLGMIEVCSENYGGRYVGLAQVWISGGHITQAITKLNERFLDPFRFIFHHLRAICISANGLVPRAWPRLWRGSFGHRLLERQLGFVHGLHRQPASSPW